MDQSQNRLASRSPAVLSTRGIRSSPFPFPLPINVALSTIMDPQRSPSQSRRHRLRANRPMMTHTLPTTPSTNSPPPPIMSPHSPHAEIHPKFVNGSSRRHVLFSLPTSNFSLLPPSNNPPPPVALLMTSPTSPEAQNARSDHSRWLALWVILACSIISLGVTLERFITLRKADCRFR